MAYSATVEGPVQNERVSERVVAEVASFTGSDPLSLEPLHDAVDPEALDKLFETDQLGLDRSSIRVRFTYCGCDVVISADGSVTVSESG